MKMIVQQTSKVTHVTKILSVLVPGVELSAAQLMEVTGIGKTSLSSTLSQMNSRGIIFGREISREDSFVKKFAYSVVGVPGSEKLNSPVEREESLIQSQRARVLRYFKEDTEMTCKELVEVTMINRSSMTTVLQSLRNDGVIKFRSLIGKSGNATHVYSRGENFSVAFSDDSTGYVAEKDYSKIPPPKQSWFSALGAA
jgi:DNA-binding transcriptional regulator GbsR (MarR family)